jgi:hypothetical protein
MNLYLFRKIELNYTDERRETEEKKFELTGSSSITFTFSSFFFNKQSMIVVIPSTSI